jgi:hypothetical protein
MGFPDGHIQRMVGFCGVSPGFLFILYDYGFFMKMGVDPWVVVV